MSIEAMSYVWKTRYKGAKKLMLLAIADRCDDEGVCYPGVPTLAKKCSIKVRAAQSLITQLETAGEIVVWIGSGIETGHGKTNRYYMKKYREMLGLKTPTVSSRIKQITPKEGMQNSAPLDDGMQNFTPQGMQNFTPQGMQNSAFNTSGDSSEDSSAYSASDDADDISSPGKKPKAKRLPKKPEKPATGTPSQLQQIMSHVWSKPASGLLNQIMVQLLGTVKKEGKRKTYVIQPGMTTEEIFAFGQWWTDTYNLDMPTNAETLYERVEEFRACEDHAALVEQAKEDLINLFDDSSPDPTSQPETETDSDGPLVDPARINALLANLAQMNGGR